MEEKGRKEKGKKKEKEKFESLINKLHDEIDENKFAEQNYEEIERKIEDIFGKNSNYLSEMQKKTFYFMHIPVNYDSAVLEKPEWLDIDKFKKGQQFARNHLAGLFLGQLYGLLSLLCHQDGLETLIMTQKSHTPYLAFQRYLSTSQSVRNWYKEDPWCKDTQAYKNILKVKKMHLATKTKIIELEKKKIKAIDIIKKTYSPLFQFITDDYSTSLSKDTFSDYWYEFISSNLTNITQMNMGYTLFGFMGFPILFPRYFGIDENADEDLENLCYVWRCIGYLLGVDDQINLCCGSLEDIRGRCKAYIDEMIKPALRRLNPQWEHMIRCIIEGHRYFLILPNFETIVLEFSGLLNLQMPALYSSMTYFQRIKYYFQKRFIGYIMKFKFMQNLANQILNSAIDKALHFDQATITELKTRSMISPLHVSFDD